MNTVFFTYYGGDDEELLTSIIYKYIFPVPFNKSRQDVRMRGTYIKDEDVHI